MLREATEFGLSQAGKLDQVVSVQALAPAGNEYGEQAGAWADEATGLRASIEEIDGREYTRAAQQTGEETHVVRLRYHAAVTAKNRFLWTSDGNRVLEILSVKTPRGRKRWMRCLCKETIGAS